MQNPTYLTPEGLEKLNQEHKKLKTETIPDIAARIDEARQLGDLSENAEYHSAKEEMAWAQTRLIELEAALHETQIIVQAHDETITIGSTMVVETDGNEKQYTIVGPNEVDPKQGKISNESPIGKAFIGHHVGETVTIAVPDGERKYTIKRVV